MSDYIINKNESKINNEIIEKYSFEKLNKIRESIENMNKFNQIEILRILTKYNSVIINENRYGIHINLSELHEKILDDILLYIKYVDIQEFDLDNMEKQKENYKNIYFTKDNKDTRCN
jgi:hypothetical protein